MHGCSDIDLEQHREIGRERRVHPGGELSDAVDRHAAPTTLVRDRGVDEAIAEHPVTTLERGNDDAVDVLEPRLNLR